MKKLTTLLFAGFIALSFFACEGYSCGYGNVIDQQTGQPMDSVLCTVVTAGGRYQYTDSVGYFNICNGMGGCVPKCRDIEIEFSKPGYKTVRMENPDSAVVYLERE